MVIRGALNVCPPFCLFAGGDLFSLLLWTVTVCSYHLWFFFYSRFYIVLQFHLLMINIRDRPVCVISVKIIHYDVLLCCDTLKINGVVIDFFFIQIGGRDPVLLGPHLALPLALPLSH